MAAKFENQSLEELSEQQTEIQERLDSGDAAVDSEFWEGVLKELHVYQVPFLISSSDDYEEDFL